jgi:Gram positive anchor.
MAFYQVLRPLIKTNQKNSSAQQNNGSNTGLPQTGVKDGMIASTLGVILMGFLGLFGIKRRKRS